MTQYGLADVLALEGMLHDLSRWNVTGWVDRVQEWRDLDAGVVHLSGRDRVGQNDFLSARLETETAPTLPCGFPDPDPSPLFGAPAMLFKRRW